MLVPGTRLTRSDNLDSVEPDTNESYDVHLENQPRTIPANGVSASAPRCATDGSPSHRYPDVDATYKRYDRTGKEIKTAVPTRVGSNKGYILRPAIQLID